MALGQGCRGAISIGLTNNNTLVSGLFGGPSECDSPPTPDPRRSRRDRSIASLFLLKGADTRRERGIKRRTAASGGPPTSSILDGATTRIEGGPDLCIRPSDYQSSNYRRIRGPLLGGPPRKQPRDQLSDWARRVASQWAGTRKPRRRGHRALSTFISSLCLLLFFVLFYLVVNSLSHFLDVRFFLSVLPRKPPVSDGWFALRYGPLLLPLL